MDKKDIEKKLMQTDKSRAVYYNNVTDQRWGDRRNYDVMINSGCIGIDGAAQLIASIAERGQN